MIPLLEQYPALSSVLGYTPLAGLPTPVQPMARLTQELDAHGLYIKRDDLSGRPYGGNKARKLEFLLGTALQEKRKAVMTFGGAGSNHALATAVYARQCGLASINMLTPQPNARSVRRNLLLSDWAGAELHHFETWDAVCRGVKREMFRHRESDGRFPLVIPSGGSSPVGIVGFVNAGLELNAQITAGLLPEPDALYVATGTMGTVVGLTLGLAAAGLRTQVVAISVTSPDFNTRDKARNLFQSTNALLRQADPSFPDLDFPEERFELLYNYIGPMYGLYTEASVEAVRRVNAAEGIRLEGVYTGKAFAALLDHLRAGRFKNKNILFWNTYNTWDFSAEIAGRDYHALPAPFHRYFEEEVQPLDR